MRLVLLDGPWRANPGTKNRYVHRPFAGPAPTPLAGVERGFVPSTPSPQQFAPTPLAGVERRFVPSNGNPNHLAPTPLVGVERWFVPSTTPSIPPRGPPAEPLAPARRATSPLRSTPL
jgi:hypothetical protein